MTENVDGVQFVWVRTPTYERNDGRRILNMVVFMVVSVMAGITRRDRPDVVVGVSVHPLAALAGWSIARSRHARFFTEITDLWPETLIQLGRITRESVAAKMMLRLEKFLYQRSERILMLWRDVGDYVEAMGIPRSKIIWLPHGVDPTRYSDIRQYAGGTERPFNVMFLGGLVPANAVYTILEAAAVLLKRGRHDIHFALIGAGTDRSRLIGLARRFALTNVEFADPVPKSQLAQIMGDADAFIYGVQDLPLYRYGLSTNKVTDYLAASRPIVFFGNSSYDPVAESGAGFTAPPADPQALAACIERLVAMSPQARIEMGRRGRSFMLTHHSIPSLTDRLLGVLEPVRQS